MGESMSRRLKLQLGGDADMEDRAFPNPFPDYEAAAERQAEEPPCSRTPLSPEELGLPFHSDGKVSRRHAAKPVKHQARRGGAGAPAMVESNCRPLVGPTSPAGAARTSRSRVVWVTA